MEKKVTTALDRVKKEKADLDKKIEKLGNLIGKIKGNEWEAHKKLFDSFTKSKRSLLTKQYRVMIQYSKILEKRIKNWFEE